MWSLHFLDFKVSKGVFNFLLYMPVIISSFHQIIMMALMYSGSCGVGTRCRTTPQRLFGISPRCRSCQNYQQEEVYFCKSSTKLLVLPYAGRSKFILNLPPILLMKKCGAYTSLSQKLNKYEAEWSLLTFTLENQLYIGKRIQVASM